MKYFLIAGERSGDLHGANLIKALKSNDVDAEIQCWGGELMENAGARLLHHYREIAIMALWEVFVKLFKIFTYLRRCEQEILAFKPDVVILIDYGGFNLRMAKILSKHRVKVFYYIPPKIWAWNTSRIKKIKKYIDKTFCILPFEQAFYQQHNCDVDYVGNPVVDAVNAFSPTKAKETLFENQITKNKVVALLPGSRTQEVKQIIPVMNEVARNFPDLLFVVAAVSNLDDDLYQKIRSLSNVLVLQEENYNLLSVADAAIVTSGTATLETALFEVPQVVVYKTSKINYAIGKHLVKVEYFSLVNLIAGKEVVKELLQHKCTSEIINKELQKLLFDEDYINKMIKSYKSIKAQLGDEPASRKAARLMTDYLNN